MGLRFLVLGLSLAVSACLGSACIHDSGKIDTTVQIVGAVVDRVIDQIPVSEREAQITLLQFDPPAVTFGLLPLRKAAIRAVRVTNFTQRPLRLLAIWASALEFSLVDAPAVPLALASGEQIEVRIRFQSARACRCTGSLLVMTDAGNAPQNVLLDGGASASR